MFEELNDNSGWSPDKPKENQSKQGYAGKPDFVRKEEVLQDPYKPVGVFVERDFDSDAKDKLFSIASKLIANKFTVRVFGGDKDFANKVAGLSTQFVEVYLPWRNFNEIDSKHTFNTLTSKEIARTHFAGWEKIQDSVKAMLASQVRLVFGDRNNSICMCIITWSKDGASKGSEVTKDTGRCSFMIKMASSYGFPVLNTSKPSSEALIERTFCT